MPLPVRDARTTGIGKLDVTLRIGCGIVPCPNPARIKPDGFVATIASPIISSIPA